MRFTRPLAAGALAVTALLTAAPAQAAPPSQDVRCLFPDCDPFWLFRPCGPLVKCP